MKAPTPTPVTVSHALCAFLITPFFCVATDPVCDSVQPAREGAPCQVLQRVLDEGARAHAARRHQHDHVALVAPLQLHRVDRRPQAHLPPLREPLLHLLRRQGRQRAPDARDHPPLCRGARRLLWQRLRARPHRKPLPSLSLSAAPLCRRHRLCLLFAFGLSVQFNFQAAYYILDELILAGEVQESSKRTTLRLIEQEEILAAEHQAPSTLSVLSRMTPFTS